MKYWWPKPDATNPAIALWLATQDLLGHLHPDPLRHTVFVDPHLALEDLAVGNFGLRAGRHDRHNSIDPVGKKGARISAQ